MALDPSTLWPLLRPAAEALAAANAQAGFSTRIPLNADVDVLGSNDGSSFIIKLRGVPPASGPTALRVDAQYWDADGHVVFLTGYSDRDGNINELELARLDLQPIGQLPSVADLRFEEPRTGFYQTTK